MQLVPQPLQPDDPEDRIRAIFGLSGDEPLPAADRDHLERYYDYLAAHLSFPFAAVYVLEVEPPEPAEHPVTAVDLLGREDCDEEDGLLCHADLHGERIAVPLSDLEVDENSPNYQLIEDYAHWFGNAPIEDFDEPEPAPLPVVSAWGRLRFVVWFMLFGAVCGAVLGSLLMAVDGTPTAILIGAAITGAIGCVLGVWIGLNPALRKRFRSGWLVAGLGLAVLGAILGALFGVLYQAAIGAIPGVIIGSILGKLLGRKATDPIKAAFFGMAIGAVAFAVYTNQDAARMGALLGAAIGVAAMAALLLLVIAALTIMARRRRG